MWKQQEPVWVQVTTNSNNTPTHSYDIKPVPKPVPAVFTSVRPVINLWLENYDTAAFYLINFSNKLKAINKAAHYFFFILLISQNYFYKKCLV